MKLWVAFVTEFFLHMFWECTWWCRYMQWVLMYYIIIGPSWFSRFSMQLASKFNLRRKLGYFISICAQTLFRCWIKCDFPVFWLWREDWTEDFRSCLPIELGIGSEAGFVMACDHWIVSWDWSLQDWCWCSFFFPCMCCVTNVNFFGTWNPL